MSEEELKAIEDRARRIDGQPDLDCPGDNSDMCLLLLDNFALVAEVRRLREAIEPFAEYARRVDPAADGRNPIDDACPPVGGYESQHLQRNAKPVPTLGDCRRAAEALAPPDTAPEVLPQFNPPVVLMPGNAMT